MVSTNLIFIECIFILLSLYNLVVGCKVSKVEMNISHTLIRSAQQAVKNSGLIILIPMASVVTSVKLPKIMALEWSEFDLHVFGLLWSGGWTSHSAIFQIYYECTVVHFPYLDLLPANPRHEKLGIFYVPSTLDV